MRTFCSMLGALGVVLACRSAPEVRTEHLGWTVRYVHRTGAGDAFAREQHPDLTVTLLDGRGVFAFAGERGRVRLGRATERAEHCQGALCSPEDRGRLLVTVASAGALQPLQGVVEDSPSYEFLGDDVEVAQLHTRGGRFVGTVHHSTGDARFTLEVRWIAEPGDPNAELTKDVLLTPLERLGARRLADRVRAVVGMPLLWDMHIETGDAAGRDVYRAAEVGNPPDVL
jgi:hypothetical protein